MERDVRGSTRQSRRERRHGKVVELKEGPDRVTILVNRPRDGVGLGSPMRAVYEDINDEPALACFEPDGCL